MPDLDELVVPERPALILPTHYHAPESAMTLGDEVADLCALAGYAPDAEQRFALDGIFGMDRQGNLTAFEVAVIAPRQNLKTGLKKQQALGKVFLLKRPLYVWTAHEFSTTQESFRDLCILIESTPEFERRVQRITRGNGDESIELDGGQRIIFRARTKGGGRGLSGDDVGYDEGFALKPEHVGSTIPLLSTRKNPQVGYYSSACLAHSTVLRGVVERGRAKRGKRLLYLEYCFPGEPGELCEATITYEATGKGEVCDHRVERSGCSLDRLDLLQQSNTQAGGRITWQYLFDEREALSATPAEYGRERAGWHDAPDTTEIAPAIDAALFRDLVNTKAKRPQRAVVSVAVSASRRWASIGVAGAGGKRSTLVFVKHGAGTGWVVPALRRLIEKRDIVDVVINLTGPAGALEPALKKAGIDYSAMRTGGMGQACAWIQDAVEQGNLEHAGQPELAMAVENARTRTSGDAEMFDQRDPDIDITPVVAAAMAGFTWAGDDDYDPDDSYL